MFAAAALVWKFCKWGVIWPNLGLHRIYSTQTPHSQLTFLSLFFRDTLPALQCFTDQSRAFCVLDPQLVGHRGRSYTRYS